MKLSPADAKSFRRLRDRQTQLIEIGPQASAGMGRVLHRHKTSPLMIVHEINVDHISSIETEHDTPVCPHGHSPLAFSIALELMEPERWPVHVVRSGGRVKCSQNIGN